MRDGLLAEVERSQRRQGSILILQRPRDTRGLVAVRSGRQVERSQRRQGRYSSWSDQGGSIARHVEVGTSGVPRETRGGRDARWPPRRGREIAAAAGLDTHPAATKGYSRPRRGEVGTTGREIAAAAGSILILERPRGLDSPSRGGRDVRCSTGNTRGSGCAMASSPRSRDRSGGRARYSSCSDQGILEASSR